MLAASIEALWSQCARLLAHVDAVLIGPGMQDEPAVCDFCAEVLDHLSTSVLVLDAAAMGGCLFGDRWLRSSRTRPFLLRTRASWRI